MVDAETKRPQVRHQTPVVEVPWDVFEALMDAARETGAKPVLVDLNRPSLVLWAGEKINNLLVVRPVVETEEETEEETEAAREGVMPDEGATETPA